jgi:hypothetical protein
MTTKKAMTKMKRKKIQCLSILIDDIKITIAVVDSKKAMKRRKTKMKGERKRKTINCEIQIVACRGSTWRARRAAAAAMPTTCPSAWARTIITKVVEGKLLHV